MASSKKHLFLKGAFKVSKIEKLVGLLKRLNSGEKIEEVEKDAENFLSQINATDLSIAEQQLMDNGMEAEDLRGLCVIHMQMLEGEVEKMTAELEEGHPVAIMVQEHGVLLETLEELESLNATLQQNILTPKLQSELLRIVRILTGAELHHQREEQALFPILEQRGISGPPTVMRLEHESLRPKKHGLEVLATNALEIEHEEFKKQLAELSRYIIFNLRDHIFKENHILYPSAIEIITEREVWAKISEQCDKIGYTPYTKGK